MSISLSDGLVLIADFISAIVLGVTIISLVKSLSLTQKQIAQNNKQLELSYEVQKAVFFKELYLMMFDDPDIRKAFYLIDYEQFVFDPSEVQLTHEIELIDKLLNYCNLLCSLYFNKMLTQQEMRPLEYMFSIVYKNPHIQAYLKYVKNIFEKEIGRSSWEHFINYCEKELPNRASLSVSSNLSDNSQNADHFSAI